jgi:hypothetical protein
LFHSIIRSLWMGWEAVFRFSCRVHPLNRDEQHLFLIARRRYLGKSFTVDGVTIRLFDPVIELHMNNKLLVQLLRHQGLMGLAVRLVQETRRSMPILAETLNREKFHGVKALYGVTFIHRHVERFGFQTFPIQQKLTERLFTWYLRQVFRAINPNASQLLATHREAFVPRIVAMSKDRLVTQFRV